MVTTESYEEEVWSVVLDIPGNACYGTPTSSLEVWCPSCSDMCIPSGSGWLCVSESIYYI